MSRKPSTLTPADRAAALESVRELLALWKRLAPLDGWLKPNDPARPEWLAATRRWQAGAATGPQPSRSSTGQAGIRILSDGAWARCADALDALAWSRLFGTEATIETPCAACGDPLRLWLRADGSLPERATRAGGVRCAEPPASAFLCAGCAPKAPDVITLAQAAALANAYYAPLRSALMETGP